jgi:hypothetical protein
VSNRWLRFSIAIVAVVSVAAAGYRFAQLESRLTDLQLRSRQALEHSAAAMEASRRFQGSLHASVAAGQGYLFWTADARRLLDRQREALLHLERLANPGSPSLVEALDLVDRLGAAEQRARDHMDARQALLAGEVIFTDARDLSDALRAQIAAARNELSAAAAAAEASIRRTRAWLMAGGVGVLVLALVLLAPIPGATPPVSQIDLLPAGRSPAGELTLNSRPQPQDEAPARMTLSAEPLAQPQVVQAEHASGDTATPFDQPDVAAAIVPAGTPDAVLSDAAAVCTDLARVSESFQIAVVLERASAVLGASGIIVWMDSGGRRELTPVASTGYDERLVARLGVIPVSDTTLTATAFREAQSQTSDRAADAVAALAVPLITPRGPVGVLAAEVPGVDRVDASRVALGTIFAAQLAGLIGAAYESVESSPDVQAQA